MLGMAEGEKTVIALTTTVCCGWTMFDDEGLDMLRPKSSVSLLILLEDVEQVGQGVVAGVKETPQGHSLCSN